MDPGIFVWTKGAKTYRGRWPRRLKEWLFPWTQVHFFGDRIDEVDGCVHLREGVWSWRRWKWE